MQVERLELGQKLEELQQKTEELEAKRQQLTQARIGKGKERSRALEHVDQAICLLEER